MCCEETETKCRDESEIEICISEAEVGTAIDKLNSGKALDEYGLGPGPVSSDRSKRTLRIGASSCLRFCRTTGLILSGSDAF